MNEIETLARSIRSEKIERARIASVETKVLDGPRLFAQTCEAMRAGIRVLRPGSSDEEIEAALWQRNYGR